MSAKTTSSSVRGKAIIGGSKTYGTGHQPHISNAMRSSKPTGTGRTLNAPRKGIGKTPRPKGATPNVRGTVAPSKGMPKKR